MQTRTDIKPGELFQNHNQAKLETGARSGGTDLNHNQTTVKIKTGIGLNQAAQTLTLKSGVKSGGISLNHNQTAAG
jgi:hypothetical protein